jgi:hypothetical protein
VIPSSAGSIMRSHRPSHHGEQTVSYFLLEDCKYLNLQKETEGGHGEEERREQGRERHTEGTNTYAGNDERNKERKISDVRKKMTRVITRLKRAGDSKQTTH